MPQQARQRRKKERRNGIGACGKPGAYGKAWILQWVGMCVFLVPAARRGKFRVQKAPPRFPWESDSSDRCSKNFSADHKMKNGMSAALSKKKKR
jgi:hypothetical protein